ncbi:MAG TPA: hypothetical protein VFT53_03165 [Candidatus Saccharimonadales bacterium]|nr:hypothetical protein [Candidatus Saccharimonadales bacterium]
MYILSVGVSRNGWQVYVSTVNSAAGRSFSCYPHLVRIAKAVVETRDLTETEVRITQDMGRTIGNTNIVATSPKDAIFYARRLKHADMSRFVRNRSMESSSELSLILARDDVGNYELKDVWIGPACPPFPDASNARADSTTYWLGHALTAGSERIEPQSVTGICPY